MVWLKIAPSSCAVERSTNPLSRSKALARLVKIVCIVSLTCDILLMKNLLGSDGPSEYSLVYHFHEAFCSLASLRLMRIRADQSAMCAINRVHDQSAPTGYGLFY